MQSPGIVGTRVDRYQVERLLGAGGFGSVYRARHVHTDATVALKLLKRSLGADQGMLERFLREARAAAAVGSEHIVRVMDAGQSAEGQAFLALEYLEGMDLKDLALREGPLPAMRVVMLVLQVLDGLDAAHARGIVHRDMKPANVFVLRRRDERGTERDFVKLLDFGISKMHGDGAGSGLTMTGVAMGTPSYMAPEQFFDARSVDARADLYSVSAMLYELLSGKLPFDAESYAHLIVKVRTEQPVPLQQLAPQVPVPLAQVVMVGLAKEAHQRWQTAKELGQALRSALNMPTAGATPAFLPSSPNLPPVVSAPEAVGLEKTHTPQPATPGAQPSMHTPQSFTPGAQPSMHTPQPGQPEAPTPQLGAPQFGTSQPNTPGASMPPPRPSAPPVASSGWVVGAATPMPLSPPVAAAPMRPAPPAAPAQKSSALKWLLIIFGLLALGGGCCTCAGVYAATQESAKPTPGDVADDETTTPTE